MAKSATKIFLKDVASGELREAELFQGIQERHLTDVEGIWQPALILLERWSGFDHRQESAHWNWRAKMKHARRKRTQQSFAIVYRDVTQGLMIVDPTREARLKPDRDKRLVYLDYLEVAPWNRPGWQPHRVFQSVGTVLVRAAIQVSLDNGHDGRIGLHSLPQADNFYCNLGMTNLGPDADYQNLCYFEFDSPAHTQKD